MKGRAVEYSKAELRFIESRSASPRREIHAAFVARFRRRDITVDHIKAACTRYGWTAGRKRWTAREDRLMRELYADTKTTKLARRLGRKLDAVYRRANFLGLVKSEAYLTGPDACRLRRGDNIGAPFRFTKGHVPANKGLRRPGWGPGRMKETQFKKGVPCSRTMPIGSQRIIDGYWYTKVSAVPHVPYMVNWKPTHVLHWQATNGRGVKPDHCLKSLDGNRLNTDPFNWIEIPRAMLPRLSGKSGRDYDNAPPELKPIILAMAKLEHAARTMRAAETTERVHSR